MSEAENLLATLSVDYSDEPYIFVNDDRTVVVPDELKHIAVEHDHNIETVIIDCLRYWDGHDFSTMTPYVNYMRPDGYKDSYRAKNLRVSDEDDSRILFDWTISANVTQIKGNISFLVYIEDPDANPCWHSRLNQQMIIDEGLTCKQQIEMAPDSIEEVLARTTASYIAEAKAEIEGKTAAALASIPEDYTTVNNMAEEALREKAAAIKMEAEGETITVNDSADNALLGLKIYGKTTQVSTTGKQLINSTAVSGVAASVSFSVKSDMTVYAKGLATAAAYLALEGGYAASKVPIPERFIAGETYTINDASLFLYSEDGGTTSFTNQTFVMPDGYDYYGIFIRINAKEDVDRLYYPMMNVGSTIAEYEPYSGRVVSPSPDYPQELVSAENSFVKICGKNLIPYPYNQSTTTSYGVTFTVQPDGGIHGTGTATDAAGIVVYSGALLAHHGVFTFSLSGVYENMTQQITLYDENSRELITRQGENIATINLDNYPAANTMRILVKRRANSAVSGVAYPQMEAGGAATKYEIGVISQSIPATCTLPGIPVTSGGNYTDSDGQQWVCDEIDFERGVYIQRIAMKVFDGTETTWRLHGDWLTFMVDWPGADGGWELNHAKASHFICGTEAYPNTIGYFAFDSKGLGYFATGHATLEEFLAWLTENPVTVIAKLTTPIETPLTDAELANFKMVRSNYPSTTVLNDSGAHMAIKYAGDTKTYVDNSSLSNGTLVDTATGKTYRLAVTNGQLTLVAV